MSTDSELIDRAKAVVSAYGDRFGRGGNYVGPIDMEIEDLRAALASPSAAPAGEPATPESAWLIESKFTGSQVVWWNGVPEGGGVSFTPDPNAAVRFPRQEDADAVAKHMHMVKVTEHVWL